MKEKRVVINKDISKPRVTHNWKILVIILILLIVLYFVIIQIKVKLREQEETECVKQQIGCCPCNAGGEEICMLKSEVIKKQEELTNCGNVVCLQVYNCVDTKCEYEEGECGEVEA